MLTLKMASFLIVVPEGQWSCWWVRCVAFFSANICIHLEASHFIAFIRIFLNWGFAFSEMSLAILVVTERSPKINLAILIRWPWAWVVLWRRRKGGVKHTEPCCLRNFFFTSLNEIGVLSAGLRLERSQNGWRMKDSN